MARLNNTPAGHAIVRLHPFRAWLPPPDLAAQISSPPYDVLTDEQVRAVIRRNPRTILRIIRPECDLPPGIEPGSDQMYRLAAERLKTWQEQGWLERDMEARFYVYRLIAGHHEQHGFVGCVEVLDYREGRLLRHEQTREEKVADRMRLIESLRAHTGLVYVGYREPPEVTRILRESEAAPPLLDFTVDGVRHTVWAAMRSEDMVRSLKNVNPAYIVDGHHRAEAASEAVYRLAAGGFPVSDEAERFPCALFSAQQLRVFPYHRCVRGLAAWTETRFVEACRSAFEVTPGPAPFVPAPGQVVACFRGSWYLLRRRDRNVPLSNSVEALDVDYLHRRFLAPVLGITDVRRDARLEFVPGLEDVESLRKRVLSGTADAAFALPSVPVEKMMEIADAGLTLPPKSTWFDPKLRSGLLVHEF